MERISNKINSMLPISLEEINQANAGLLNRIDSKFLIHIEELIYILEALPESYRVLELEHKRVHRYETLYFDTNDFQLYMMHHNKKGNRFKVRIRRYVENNLVFLEVKNKTNKAVTKKQRIKLPYFPENLQQLDNLSIQSILPVDDESLKPQLWTLFNRITLVNVELQERMTIDLNLMLRNNESEVMFEDLVVMELKREKSQTESPIMDLMKEMRIRQADFSKYSMGTALINDCVKKNAFKSKLHTLRSEFHWQTK
ncbi:MAG: polyphosphate polymerase domain-containing protein [Bacteroidia bacterium]